MSTITKQQAQKIIEAADEVITALAGTNEDVHPDNSTKMVRLYDDLNDHYAPPEVVRELARIALASLEAEAVCYLTWHQGFRAPDDCEEYVVEAKPGDKSCDGSPAFPVYAAPPAPVSDEDKVLAEQARAVVHCLDMCGVPSGDYADNEQLQLWGRVIEYGRHPASVSVPDGYRLQPISEYDAMCAAMLQGAEPVTTAYKLPEETGSSLQLRNLIRQRHAEWSQATFGDVGPVGPLKHLSKEALEAAADPGDLSEWADMQFLLWDAQRRAGITDEQITEALEEKLKVNMARQWPEPKDGEPRLHIKEAGNTPVIPDGLRLALSNAGIAAPESDEMLAATCEKYIQALVTWVKERKPFRSAVIPDGWALVPVEPTEDMIVNGFESEPNESFSNEREWEAYDAMSGCQQAAHRAKLCWAAMIAAAPQQESKNV